jgi:hypothetical protein
MTENKTTYNTVIQAKMEIEHAAAQAVSVISAAAGEAAKVVAEAAANSIKVLQEKGSNDHDLLIELKTRMESLRNDIKDIKDGTAVQLADHEKRIFSMETSKTRTNTLMSIGIGIGAVIVSMLIAHLFGIGI